MLFVASTEAQFLVWWISAFFLTLNSFHRKRFALYSSASRRFHSYDVKKSNFFRKNYFKFSWILKKIQKDTFPYKLTLFDYFSFHCSHDPHIQIQLFFLFHMIFKCQIYLVETFEKKMKNWRKTPQKLISAELLHLAKLLVCYCSVHQKRFI